MELNIEIETHDSRLSFDLFETDKLAFGTTTKTVAEGVSIQYRGGTIREAAGLPEIFRISAFIGKNVVLPIAVGILSAYLYDKFKGKAERVRINNIYVEVNVNRFENLILEILKKEVSRPSSEEKGEHIYFVKLEFPEMSSDELLQSARTLINKPMSLNERQLPANENRLWSEEASGKLEIVAFIRDEEINNTYKKGKQLYALARYEVKCGKPFSISFMISTKNISHGSPLKEIEKKEDMPSWW